MPSTPRFIAALALTPLLALAQPAPLLSIDDPEGDDVGDGSLVYPREAGYANGDLDLRSLKVFDAGRELRFEATFANPIRHPSTMRGTGLGSEDLSVFARRGFYAFNLDIYLVVDRRAGAGNTVGLPGRGVRFEPGSAWDRVIVLTPRPELMQRQLAETLAKASPAPSGQVEATLERSVFFATDVRVRGRTVSFTVPTSFVDARALAGASLTALVTMAKPTIEADLAWPGGDGRPPLERLTLGVAQPEPGRPAMAMGYRAERAPATAVVDLLTADPRQQALQLAPGGLLASADRAPRATVATMPAPAPAPAPAAPASTGGSWFSRALDRVAGWFGAGSAAASSPAAPAAPAAGPAPSLQTLMVPAPAPAPAAPQATPPAPAAAPAVVAPAAPAPAPAPARPAAAGSKPRDAAYFEEQELRLRTLDRLRKSGLITEAEYQQKRKEVLDAL